VDLFKNGILSLKDIFSLLNSPRDLTEEEFHCLSIFCSLKPWKHIIESIDTPQVVIDCGISSTLSEVRRMIKANALSIGKRKVKDFSDTIQPEDFFETGIEGLKWTTVKHGKKIQEVILTCQ